MSDPTLVVGVSVEDDERIAVTAPAVGVWSEGPAPGTVVGPAGRVGRLRRLNRFHALVLPEAVAGVVEDGHPDRSRGVAFQEVLFRLRPLADAPTAGPATTAAGHGVPDLPAGAHAILAPTDGVFYGRPSPDAAPFVEPGSRVRRGEPVGLVEVMKTFSQIVYGGAGLPEEAEVLEVRVTDGNEIAAGQALIIVR